MFILSTDYHRKVSGFSQLFFVGFFSGTRHGLLVVVNSVFCFLLFQIWAVNTSNFVVCTVLIFSFFNFFDEVSFFNFSDEVSFSNS